MADLCDVFVKDSIDCFEIMDLDSKIALKKHESKQIIPIILVT